MKKIFLIPAGLILALGFQSCQQNTGDDGRAQQQIDSTVNVRLVTLRDSMMMECNRMVLSAAQAKADSTLLAVNTAKGSKGSKGTKPATTPSTGSTTKPGNDVNNRPGSNQNNQNSDVNTRPGSNQNNQQSDINKRPGTNNPK